MLCPHCLNEKTPVLKTDKADKIVRLRKCSECNYVFVTQELHKCTVCKGSESKVVSTIKDLKNKRFRICLNCTNRYITYEAVFIDHLWSYYVELYS